MKPRYSPPAGSLPARILAVLRDRPEGMSAQQLAPIYNGKSADPANVVRVTLSHLEQRGAVARVKQPFQRPVIWQIPVAAAAAEHQDDPRAGMIMEVRPTSPPPEPLAHACCSDHAGPGAHRLMMAVLNEMPPAQKGAMSGDELGRWLDVLRAVLEAVYWPFDCRQPAAAL